MRPCTYCGAPDGTNRDHVVPVSYTHNVRTYDTPTVPSCGECNNLLGNRMYVTIQDRARFLTGALKRHNKAVLRTPKWSPGELAEFGPRLRRTVEASAERARSVLARIAHCSLVAHA